jgi:hypothetical protein
MRTPIKRPRITELRLLESDSYMLSLRISLLVMPIALKTPSSHMLSRMLADIDTINWKKPSVKQTREIANVKKSSMCILSSISSLNVTPSNATMLSSPAKLSKLFFRRLLYCFVVPDLYLTSKVVLGML